MLFVTEYIQCCMNPIQDIFKLSLISSMMPIEMVYITSFNAIETKVEQIPLGVNCFNDGCMPPSKLAKLKQTKVKYAFMDYV